MSKTATTLSNLLDLCSEFTKGQEEIQEVDISLRKMKKSKGRKSDEKVSSEEKAYANYIGHQYDISGTGGSNFNGHNLYDHRWDFTPVNSNGLPSNAHDRTGMSCFGIGRGRGFNTENPRGFPMNFSEVNRQTRQELNDRVIGEQLRQMGIGIPSDQDLEAEFQKKYKVTEPAVLTVDDDDDDKDESITRTEQLTEIASTSNQTNRKTKIKERALYVPPHLRSSENLMKNGSSTSSLNLKAESNVSNALKELSLVSGTDVSTVSKNINEVNSSSSDETLDKISDSIQFSEANNARVDKSATLSVIQFNVKSNTGKGSGGRNALINGLLKRMAEGDQEEPSELDSKSHTTSNGVDGSSKATGTRNLQTDTQVHNRQGHNGLDDFNNNYVSTSFLNSNASKTKKTAVKSRDSSRSSSSCSTSCDNFCPDQSIYYTAPVSGKIIMVKPAKSYIDIMPRSRKPHTATLGDFMSEEPSQSSTPATPLVVEMSDLNPCANEFSPRSRVNKCSSDGDSFNLDDKEFPPL